MGNYWLRQIAWEQNSIELDRKISEWVKKMVGNTVRRPHLDEIWCDKPVYDKTKVRWITKAEKDAFFQKWHE